MGLVLNEEQRILRDSAKELLGERAPVKALRKLRDERDPDGFSRELWQELAQLGWAGMALPEHYGGSEFGFQGLGIAFEEAGRTLAATPLLSTVVLSGHLVFTLGNDVQRERLLPAVASGDMLLALALEEGTKHHPTWVRTRAEPSEAGFTLNGQKTFVLDGHVADELLVVARSVGADDDPNGLGIYLVPTNTQGLTIERTVMVDSRNAARLSMTNVQVDTNACLGTTGNAGAALEQHGHWLIE